MGSFDHQLTSLIHFSYSKFKFIRTIVLINRLTPFQPAEVKIRKKNNYCSFQINCQVGIEQAHIKKTREMTDYGCNCLPNAYVEFNQVRLKRLLWGEYSTAEQRAETKYGKKLTKISILIDFA